MPVPGPTASNLHAAPGDILGVELRRVKRDGVVGLPHADPLFQTVRRSRCCRRPARADR